MSEIKEKESPVLRSEIPVPFRFRRRITGKDGEYTEDFTPEMMYDDREQIVEGFQQMRKYQDEKGRDISYAPWIVAMSRFVTAWENAIPG